MAGLRCGPNWKHIFCNVLCVLHKPRVDYTLRGICGVTVTLIGNGHDDLSSKILMGPVCISHSTNTLGKL